MLDSSSRMPAAKRIPTLSPVDWDESTFTRPMRSPFAEARTRTPTPRPRPVKEIAVDVNLEEASLFETPKKPALRRVTTAPPPRRSVPPSMEEETTSKHEVHPELLRAIRDRDSSRMRQVAAVMDLTKTMEEPVLDVCEEHLEASTIRSSD
jgi:hypothetical protein